MKKDIDFPTVEGVKVAIVRKKNEINEFEWFAYLLNTDEVDLYNVIISCRGYGEINGEKRATSTLRYFFEHIPALSSHLIEPISPEVFVLSSEYWVSYYIQERIFDKKFVFPPEMIEEENYVYIKQIDLEGILQ
ncbi:hypothetical protein AD998_09955 [bacterium 336/3]|jgi:hypothetical protein|nr:hypothetical protein AD998_09955 [bacterium 336/3]